MKPQYSASTRFSKESKARILNQPEHTLSPAEQEKLAHEPAEVTCPIVRETL